MDARINVLGAATFNLRIAATRALNACKSSTAAASGWAAVLLKRDTAA